MPITLPEDRVRQIAAALAEEERATVAYRNAEAYRRLVEAARLQIRGRWYDLPPIGVGLAADIHNTIEEATAARGRINTREGRDEYRAALLRLATLLHRAFRPTGWRRAVWWAYNPFLRYAEGEILTAAGFAFASRMRSDVRDAAEAAAAPHPPT
jgi:hypothetical protein